MDLSELRLELMELVLDYMEHQHKLHKPYNKLVLESVQAMGPKTVAELEPYKPKLHSIQDAMQLAKVLETYITTGKV